MIETITNMAAFQIVLSGVLIFTAQRLISDLWISPNIEFQKCLGKIDALLIRYEFLCGYEQGSNNGANDEDVKFFKQELKSVVMDLVGKFRSLFFLERLWLTYARKINVNQAKPLLLYLSQIVSTKKDVTEVESKAKKAIEDIRLNLKFKAFKIDYGKI